MNKKHISRILYSGITGFILGIFYAEFSDILYPLAISFLISMLVFYYKRNVGLILIIFFLCFFAGFTRLNIEQDKPDSLQNHVGTEVSMRGIVVSEISESAYYRNFEIQPKGINSQKILIRTSYQGDIKMSEELIVTGVLEQPKPFSNESGIDFDYPGFLRAKGTGYILPKAWIEHTGAYQRNFKSTLYKIKQSFIHNINSIYHFPESALLSGLLVGHKESLGDDLLDDFRRAGLTHIIVLSGFNIAIVAIIILSLTAFLPRAFSLSLAVLGIFLFAMMVGFESTVLRATLMVLISLGGKFINRSYDALRALMIAGFFMLFINPHLLMHDVSFELSFLASLSLVLVSPVIERFFTWVPSLAGFREIIVSTVSVELLVIPLLLFRIGEISVVSLFSNILVLPIIGPTMLFGFLAGLASYVWQPLAIALGYPAQLLLQYELFVVDRISELDFALVSFGVVSPAILFLIYAVIVSLLVLLKNRAVSLRGSMQDI